LFKKVKNKKREELRKMKNKLKLFTTLMIATLGFNVLSVNAANESLDATTCKDGKVYTNYYFFLDASATTSSSSEAVKKVTYSTSGYYAATAPNDALETEIAANGFKNFNSVGGSVPIDYTNINKDISIDGVGLKNFYTLYKNGNARADSGTAYVVEHNWSQLIGQVNTDPTDVKVSILEEDDDDLVNASLKMNKETEFPEEPVKSTRVTNYPIKIDIVRYYDQGFTPELDSSDFVPVVTNHYVQPALYYVQYCEKTEATTKKTITYDKGNIEATPDKMPESQEFTDSATLSDLIPVVTGYQFVEWNTQKDGKGTSYKPSDKYTGDSITLYAIWSSTYTVHYDANGGLNAPADDTKQVGTPTTISKDKPTQTGNEFLGWSTDKNAKEPMKIYDPGSTYSDGKDLNLYAVWRTKTGIGTHIAAFATAIVVAGGALVLLNRKKIFRQI